MKKALFLLSLCSMASCFQPERNCQDYRTGTFEFETYLKGELVTSRFVRNDSLEIDFFQGKSDTSSVRWINDCEFIIKNLNPKSRADRQAIHMKILTTSRKGYVFEYGIVGDSRRERGEVRKVQD